MIPRIIAFIQYHNAVSIAVTMLVTGVGIAAASPAARDALYTSTEIVRSVDNSYIRSVDLGQSDTALKINSVVEDENAYDVEYSYHTIAVQEYAWQPVLRVKKLSVSKIALGTQDLGTYLAEQLGQVVDQERSYLASAQKIEREKGPSMKIVTSLYAGLVGRMLDPKDKVFSGYEPVVKEPVQEITKEAQEQAESEALAQTQEGETRQALNSGVSREAIQQIIEEYLASKTQQDAPTVAVNSPDENSPQADPESPPANSSPPLQEAFSSNPSAGTGVQPIPNTPASNIPAVPSPTGQQSDSPPVIPVTPQEPESISVSTETAPDAEAVETETVIEVIGAPGTATETVTPAEDGVQ